MNSRAFERKLKATLAHNRIRRPLEREKSGLINPRRIGLFGSTERIFSKPSEAKLERDYSVSILLDQSGSMHHQIDGLMSRQKLTAKLVLELSETLDKIDGLDYEISAFAETDYIIKPFGVQFRNRHDVMDNTYLNHSLLVSYHVNHDTGDIIDMIGSTKIAGYSREYINNIGSDNHDSLALSRTYERLAKRQGKKILLIISDGAPTYSGDLAEHETIRGSRKDMEVVNKMMYSPMGTLREVARNISRDTSTLLAGIGIDTDVVDIYPVHARVSSQEEFRNGLTRLLAKNIIKI